MSLREEIYTIFELFSSFYFNVLCQLLYLYGEGYGHTFHMAEMLQEQHAKMSMSPNCQGIA